MDKSAIHPVFRSFIQQFIAAWFFAVFAENLLRLGNGFAIISPIVWHLIATERYKGGSAL